MIDLIVLIAGIIVFAITVYGTVMGAGIALTRTEIAEQPELLGSVDEEELAKRVPQIKY